MPDYTGHITHEEYLETLKTQLVDLAQAILHGDNTTQLACIKLLNLLTTKVGGENEL